MVFGNPQEVCSTKKQDNFYNILVDPQCQTVEWKFLKQAEDKQAIIYKLGLKFSRYSYLVREEEVYR